MIDPLKIQQDLKDHKLTTMTEVIHFVIEQVYKMMSYDPIQELSYRISDLQKPKGLDQIMIEQVKTLIEAIFQQKQELIRKDLQKTVHHNVEFALEQQNTRRSMKEIDVLQLINSANQSRKSSIFSINKNQNHHMHNLETIKRQIQQIRAQLQKKPDRREMNQKNLELQKQISKKMPLSEAERIVEKFQKQIFGKINENYLVVQKMEYHLKKNLIDDLHEFKREFTQNNKIKELKSNFNKVDKKVKKLQGEVQQNAEQFQRQTIQTKNQMRDSINQLCVLIQSLNQIKDQKKFPKKQFMSAVWSAQTQYNMNNMAICWSTQISNDDQCLYCFEAKKSQIMVSEPGYYRIEFMISGCEKPPCFFINSQAKNKLQQKSHKFGFGTFSMIQMIKISSEKSLLSFRLQENTVYERAIMRISKID